MLDQLRERPLFQPKQLLIFTVMAAMLLALVLSFASVRNALADAVPTPSFLFNWGSSGSGDGQFNGSIALAIDSSGNVYVSDQLNNRIQKFDAAGNFILEWGGLPTGSGDGEFSFTFDVAIDASDNVYVVDIFNQRIQKFDTSGNFLLKWGSGGTGDGQFGNPVGVAVDALGDNVYVTDFQNHRVQKFDDTGTFILEWGSVGSGVGEFNFPYGVAVDSSGNVYVTENSAPHRVQKFDANGNFLLEWGSLGTGDGQFNLTGGISVDSATHVYVSDVNNQRIQVFHTDGTFITKFGAGEVGSPWESNVAPSGDIYVVDTSNLVHVYSGGGGGGGSDPAAAIQKTSDLRTALNDPSNNIDYEGNSNSKNKARNNLRWFNNQVDALEDNIDDGLFASASASANSILGKVDGCAGLGGAPDRNDKILNCTGQGIIDPLVRDLIDLLEELVP